MSNYTPVLESFEYSETSPSDRAEPMQIHRGSIMADDEFIHDLPSISSRACGFEGGRYASVD